MVGIIDYGAGNISSVKKAVEALGQQTVLSSDPRVLLSADRLILPGVGAFGKAMEQMRDLKLDLAVHEACRRGIPLLGICLGLQLLFEESPETPGVKGLSVFRGAIEKIPAGNGRKIPHMGWNSLDLPRRSRLFAGMDQPYVYFVHSYYLQAEDRDIVAATTDYNGLSIDAAVESGRVYACQFHPEKSGDTGLRILEHFLQADLCTEGV